MSGSNNEENTREKHTVTVIKNKNGRFIVEGIDSSSKPVAANTVTAKANAATAPVAVVATQGGGRRKRVHRSRKQRKQHKQHKQTRRAH